MRKCKEQSDPNSCFNRAHPDEIIFVLLGRDKAASFAIREWAKERIRIGKNSLGDAQIVEALNCANLMDEFEEPKPCEKPAWEPGTPCAERGCEPVNHKFKVGDWFEWRYAENNDWNGSFYCHKVLEDNEGSILHFTENRYAKEHYFWINAKYCRHVSGPRKESIAGLSRQEMADGHYVCEPVKPQDPFTGAHWDRARSTVASKGRSGTDNLDLCRIVIELADEVRRLKECLK